MAFETNLSAARQTEVESKLVELFERYHAAFEVKLSKGEVLEIIAEVFSDNRKNFIKSKLGPITFADRDFIAHLFSEKRFLSAEDEEKNTPKNKGVTAAQDLDGDGQADGGEPKPSTARGSRRERAGARP